MSGTQTRPCVHDISPIVILSGISRPAQVQRASLALFYGGSYVAWASKSVSGFQLYVYTSPSKLHNPFSCIRNSLPIIWCLYFLQILPLVIPLSFFFLLPHQDKFACFKDDALDTSNEYAPLPVSEDVDMADEGLITSTGLEKAVALSVADKWTLAKPLLAKYMLPLCESLCH